MGSQWKPSGIADIVMTILEARKTTPGATAAAVSRESRGEVIRRTRDVSWTARRHRPAGGLTIEAHGDVIAAFTARRLGEDLAAAFGQRDVIILK